MSDVARYAVERLLTWKVAALVSLLVGLTWIMGPIGNAAELGIRLLVVGLPTLAFRLWDDLADRAHDRQAHPARVLSRMTGPAPLFGGLVVTLLLACLGCLFAFREAVHILFLALATVAMALVYAGKFTRRTRSFLVLLKYPVIVMLGVPSAVLWQKPGRLALVLAASWLCVAAFDALERRFSPSRKPEQEKTAS